MEGDAGDAGGDPAPSGHDDPPPAKRRQTQTQATLMEVWNSSSTGSQAATPQQSLSPACSPVPGATTISPVPLSAATTAAAEAQGPHVLLSAAAASAEVSPVPLSALSSPLITSTVAAAATGRAAAEMSALSSTTTQPHARSGACEKNRPMEAFPPTGPVVVQPALALVAQRVYLVKKAKEGSLPTWVIITAEGMACTTCRSVASVICSTSQGKLKVDSKAPWVYG